NTIMSRLEVSSHMLIECLHNSLRCFCIRANARPSRRYLTLSVIILRLSRKGEDRYDAREFQDNTNYINVCNINKRNIQVRFTNSGEVQNGGSNVVVVSMLHYHRVPTLVLSTRKLYVLRMKENEREYWEKDGIMEERIEKIIIEDNGMESSDEESEHETDQTEYKDN
ncbi:hypothetical protein L9F63_006870, partial [Diploptera punctata]